MSACERCFAVLKGTSRCALCGFYNWGGGGLDPSALVDLDEVAAEPVPRYTLGIADGAWGKDMLTGVCGLARSSCTLLAGDPGAGKSRLALQILIAIAVLTDRPGLLLANEMSGAEIKGYATAMGLPFQGRLKVPSAFAGAGVILGIGFEETVKKLNPSAIVLDSVSKATRDENERVAICKQLKATAVALGSPVIIIDHMTKQGDMAGLLTLQHDVDTVATLIQLDKRNRLLTTWKNRFQNGATPHEVFLITTDKGLEAAPDLLDSDGKLKTDTE